ncbi:hypothetical protein [Deinococcus frigens]|uniref:hypothetical protein n=1 Tax=Deinococcus frigens TaxID=249403 RepID=UPI0004952846|nr:hypothetical protein [Deinococcus frigens]
MSSAPTLNAYPSPQWAAVVSGVAWKAYTLAPDGGALSVEAIRGPVIVWAKAGGEEEAVKLAPPTPSPLEVRAAAVNAAPHFERFRWAARGEVQPSVWWKTGARVRRARKLEALRQVRATSRLIQRRAEGRTGIQGRPADRTAKGRRAAVREAFHERKAGILRSLYPSPLGFWHPDGIDLEALEMLREAAGVLRRGECPYNAAELLEGAGLALSVLGYRAELGHLIAARHGQAKSLEYALSFLERAARRAHLARRVKPIARRTRVRRPLYARPRPPTAPLAPPVI